jgi:hypothetical protein
MKFNLLIFFLIFSSISFSQNIKTGLYEDGLKIAFDSITKKVTGYYESYTGLDFDTNKPKFSCRFYLEGKLIDTLIHLETYYPGDKKTEFIQGKIQILNRNQIALSLNSNHGGCWNVQNFTEEQIKFELEVEKKWTQIRFIKVDKSYFYSEKSTQKRKKSYLIKNNFVCVEKIENEWAFCTFYGEKTTSGWILVSDLNSI